MSEDAKELAAKKALEAKVALMRAACPCLSCSHLRDGRETFTARYACQKKQCVVDPFKPRQCGCYDQGKPEAPQVLQNQQG